MRLILSGSSALMGLLMGLSLALPPAFAQERAAMVRVGSFAGAYLAGRVAETDNDLATAIAYYERALSFDPDNQALKQSLMLGLISTGSFDEALKHAEALKDVPEAGRFSRLALAADAIRQDDHEKAVELLDMPLQSDLDRLLIGVVRAWARAGAGDVETALADMEELSGPDWFTVFVGYHSALLAEWAGLDEEAEAAYEAVAEDVSAGGAAPETYLRAAEAHARFLSRNGRAEEALAALDRAEEFVVGRVPLISLRKKIEAGEEVEPLVTTIAHGASEMLLNLGAALNRGGGESFVRLYLQYALALRPDGDSVLVQLGSTAEQQNNAEEAIDYYSRVPEGSPIWRLAQLQQGLNLADLDRHEEAIEHLKLLLEDDPDDMRAYLALGGVYHSMEDYASGAELYELAVARIQEPGYEHWNIFYQRGIAYERLKQWERAEPNFKKALELNPDHPQVLNYLGYSWVDMNMNLDAGLDLIKRAVDQRPSDGYIVDSLGWAYYRLERYEDAVRELERAVNLMPYDPILNDHLGDAYWRAGRRLEATFQWRHARDLDPEPELLEEIQAKLRDGLPDKEEAAAREEVQVAAAEPIGGLLEDASGNGGETRTATALAEPLVAAEAGHAVHVVQPGQSLWSISVDLFGIGARYRDILDLNPELGSDPDRLVPGQELRVPGPAD